MSQARLLILVLVLLGFLGATGARAADPGTHAGPKPPGAIYEGGGRVGGDTIADAVAIPSLPFSDTGNTCGFADDYDYPCPYLGSTSPEVVYSYVPLSAEVITIRLCASSYDTKVYVRLGSPPEYVACNDDAGCGYSGWQSEIDSFPVSAGVTYYIMVDGYGGACGDYVLEVSSFFGGCPAWNCPPGALEEGEPDCDDDYVDEWNGGCNSTGWTPIWAQADGRAVMCGKSGTYVYQGSSYRDTDWFTATGTGGPLTMTGCSTFPLAMFLIWGLDCDNLQYDYVTAGVLEEVSLTHDFGLGAEAWLWMGPSVFSGVTCGSRYLLEVSGIGDPPVPVSERSWGSIKAGFSSRRAAP